MSAPLAGLAARGAAVQQKDFLCGAYWAAQVLRDAGFGRWGEEEVDEDLMARAAGTLVPREVVDGSVPPGAESRTDYRFELPTADAGELGTAVAPLAHTLEAASGGELRCVPLHGDWSAERVAGLVEVAPGLGARLVANLRTGSLWASRPSPGVLLDELDGRESDGPPAEWDVGHFCELAWLLRGPGGALVLVNDSYPQLGWEGRHLQPPRAVAAALARGDGSEGGVLAIAPTSAAPELERLADTLGLEVGIWENGTPGR